MLAFLLPAALFALAALALPALVHLARRSEATLTEFAALRWLDRRPKPRQRLRFDEWPLLLVRLLLIALAALWLARPVLRDTADATPWVAVVPGVDVSGLTLADDAERRWLAPGFPPLTATPPPAGSVASLVRQLDAELPAGAPLTVVVPERLAGLDSERLRLTREVEWVVRAGTMQAATVAAAPPPSLAVRYAAGEANTLRYLRAAAVAWQAPDQPLRYAAASADAPLPARSEVLVWLVPGDLPAAVHSWVKAGGTALIGMSTNVDMAGGTRGDIATEVSRGRGRLLQLTQPLAPAAMPALLEPDFPQRLRALLADAPPPPTQAFAADVAPLRGASGYVPPAREVQPWLALLIAALLIVERWMATRRTRRVAP
ncbi:BatA domain-containing protein [Sphingoaurantiacus capsulatus]|uniref:BatA domain-containing protein n=1 Tax=Sphingoaurantiacus capsulatus TaxID=1771310 RepID=A0ABV7XE88_9SPHN